MDAAASTKSKQPKNIRHAEKRRTATCAFADRVARISVQHYKNCLGPQHATPLTCVATIVAHSSIDNTLSILSMGVGTKFLKYDMLMSKDYPYGSRVRDMHAEILCQRAFKRYLLLEMKHHIVRERKRSGEDSTKNRILMPLPHQPSNPPETKPQFTLRADVTLHFYCSSVPCGNASLKKFCKLQKETYLEDLADDQWPDSIPHDPTQFGSSISLGEFSLLLKKDTSKPPPTKEKDAEIDTPSSITTSTASDNKSKSSNNTLTCPPGTVPATVALHDSIMSS